MNWLNVYYSAYLLIYCCYLSIQLMSDSVSTEVKTYTLATVSLVVLGWQYKRFEIKAKLGRVGSKRTQNAPGLTYENLGTRVVAVERWSLHHGEGAHFDDVKLPLYAPDRREDVT